MRFPVDLSLFDDERHSPSLAALERTMPNGSPELRDYCIPVNPYFPTPSMLSGMRERFEQVVRYYPAGQAELAGVLRDALNLNPDSIVLGNGSTELITWIDLLLIRGSLATPVPTFGYWTDHPARIGHRVEAFPLRADDEFAIDVDRFVRFVRRSGARAAVVCNPNNPTGSFLPVQEVRRMLDALADLDLVVVDESFIDFADEWDIPSVAADAMDRPNVIVLKSLGKNCGLHGVRAGYAVTSIERAAALRHELPGWNINGLAEMLIREFAANQRVYEACRRRAVRDREAFEAFLRSVPGLTVYPSRANFVYVRLPDRVDGRELRNLLLTEYGYLIRSCGNKLGSDDRHLRIASRPRDQAEELSAALGRTIEALAAMAQAA